MRAFIIGNGFIAQKHKEAIKEIGWEYLGAYDPVPSRCEKPLGEAEKADVIHICTPNVFHQKYLEMFPDKIKVVEKPIIEHSDIDAVVCFQRRFNSQCQKIKKLCDKKKPEKIICNILVQRDPQYWECWRGDKEYSGGGAFLNIGIHYLDLLRWWLGRPDRIVSADFGVFNRVVDEGGSAELVFGKTVVKLNISSRFHKRDISMVALWKDRYEIYDTDDATHTDVLKHFLKGDYVTPSEAFKSYQLYENICSYTNNSH